MLIGEVTKHIGIDRIVAKRLRVLLQTDPAEPTVDVQVQSHGSCQRQFLKRVKSWARVIPRGFSNQPWIRHVRGPYEGCFRKDATLLKPQALLQKRYMTDYAFKIGQMVEYRPTTRLTSAVPGPYR